MEVALAEGEGHLNRTWRHGTGWKTVALYSVDGRTDEDALRWAGWDANYQPTPILERCPYFQEVIAGFQCPIFRVRLSRLAAGTSINPHRDKGDTWAIGKIRLHIPIVTNEDVWFFIDDQRVIMREGELWYADVSPLHSVNNRSDQDRVHLMLDVGVNDWLRKEFPKESLAEEFRTFVNEACTWAKSACGSCVKRRGSPRFASELGTCLANRRGAPSRRATAARWRGRRWRK